MNVINVYSNLIVLPVSKWTYIFYICVYEFMSDGIQEVNHLACVKYPWLVYYFLLFLCLSHVGMHIEHIQKRQCLLFCQWLSWIIKNRMTLKIIFRYKRKRERWILIIFCCQKKCIFFNTLCVYMNIKKWRTIE
jgi:hypothetical protein